MNSVNNNNLNNELVDYSQRLPNEYKRIQTLEQMLVDNRKELPRACRATALAIIPLAAATIALSSGSIFFFLGFSVCYVFGASTVGLYYGHKFKQETGRSLFGGQGLEIAVGIAGGSVIMPFYFAVTHKKRVEESLKTAKFTMNGSAVCWQVRAAETDLFKEELKTVNELEPFLLGERIKKDLIASQKWLDRLQTRADQVKQIVQQN